MKNKLNNSVRAFLLSWIIISNAFYANTACGGQGPVLCPEEAVLSERAEDRINLSLAGLSLGGQGKNLCCIDRVCMPDSGLVLGPHNPGFPPSFLEMAVSGQVFSDRKPQLKPVSGQEKPICSVPIYTLVQAFLC